MKQKAMSRLTSLKSQLDSLYFTSEYERLQNVIRSIRAEIVKKKA